VRDASMAARSRHLHNESETCCIPGTLPLCIFTARHLIGEVQQMLAAGMPIPEHLMPTPPAPAKDKVVGKSKNK
jgi:hypothetical protein